MATNILITGGSGLIGSRLTQLLQERGYEVSHLSRNPAKKEGVSVFKWDIEKQEMDENSVKNADYIIHLAGANVGDKRWTKGRKEEIIKSRSESARLLYNTLEKNPDHHIKGIIAASGVNIYGEDTGGAEMLESSPYGRDFLAHVVQKWEASTDKLGTLGIRLVKLRTGMVLSNKSGALPKLAQPIKWGGGAALGSGDQFISWIHIDDLCRMYIFAMENDEVEGVYNAVAPKPVTNAEMTKIIARILNKPLFLPNVPGFALKFALGELAAVVLGGQKVSSKKIQEAGFRFKYANPDQALKDLLGTKKESYN